jgi:sialate O-acetylesterase
VVVFAAAISSWAQTQDASLRFADPLTDNIVVQQNKPFRVWGKAPAGQSVKIETSWLKQPVTVIADVDGSFLGIISVPAVKPGDFTKHTLQISTGAVSKTLHNVLIGEVWFCGGQSNMQSPVQEIVDGAAEVAKANHPHIRLFYAALNFSNTPLDNVTGQWVECTPQTVEKFSAVAFFFARQLHTTLNVPVGVIFSGIGASAAQAYVPRDVLAGDHVLDSAYLKPYLASERSKEVVDGGFSFEKVTRPFLLYNAMIHPFRHLSIRGFGWYQGESNRNERSEYIRLMHTLIDSWRTSFAQGELPFYYVQVAPFFWDKEDPTLADYAFFREAQEKISALNNTAMVSTTDVGEAKDLHPKNKKPTGIRLSLLALHRTYEQLSVDDRGPEIQWVSFDKGNATVNYFPETVRTGLRTRDGAAPRHFELAGEDRVFYPATAVIQGNQVKVTSAKVKRPVALRYAFTNYAVTNLENGNGLPAFLSRTDAWPEKKDDKK